MCGITGIHSETAFIDPSVLSAMTDSLRHRGPDDSGTYVSEDRKVGLGHTRLSILDLSERGRQPMGSDDGRIQVSYNGEIYNYREIRKELRSLGHVFRTECDTEVLVRAYEQWGIGCLDRFIGMFALAIWDGWKNELYLARDRVGIKPLYYYMENGLFLFASELKAIMKHPGFGKRISPDGLALFLRYDYVRSPHTIFENTFKLEPGHYLCLKNGEARKRRYWDAAECWNAEPWNMDEEEACDMFEEILADSIRYRLVSDVPVGVFLSGGIDSSLVTAMLRKNSPEPLKTFTIGFEDDEYNEAVWAKKVAEHIGTDHTELYVSEEDAMNMVFDLPSIYDEPFGDDSSIPTCAVSKLARESVKVVMSGDGGDELFCGYNHYARLARTVAVVEKIPGAVRGGIRSALSFLGVSGVESLAKTVGFASLSRDYHKVRASLLAVLDEDMARMYRSKWSAWFPEDFEGLFKETPQARDDTFDVDFAATEGGELVHRMLYASSNVWLPDNILTKVDRASMSTGLEAREPLLDHRLVRFAAETPVNFKYRNGENKYLLRKVLSRHLPRELYDRPKTGFVGPVDSWLRGKLRPVVMEYLGPEAIKKSGVFDPDEVSRWTRRFYDDSSIKPERIWNLLTFQMWHEKWH